MARKIRGPVTLSYSGLKELRAALQGFDPALARQLTTVNKTIAQAVVTGARARGGALTHPRPGHEALGTLKATAGQLSASVKYGDTGVPWALGEEFGSIRYHQFPPWRGNGTSAGYFLWPTIRDELPRLFDAYDEMIQSVLAQVFPAGGGGAEE